MYGVIGEKLKHSFSKEIHEAIGEYEYNIIEVEREKLEDFILSKNYQGLNVTIPYKEEVIKYLDYIDPVAKEINAVNTIVNKNNKLYGYNTDYLGLSSLFKYNNITLKNKKVLILGTGGTSKTSKYVCLNEGASLILQVSRNPKPNSITYEDIKNYLDIDIIINTTPCGMYPNDDLIIDLKDFKHLEFVCDVIYNPLKTRLMRECDKYHIKNCNGLYMLTSQAVYASSLFLDKKVDLKIINKIYKDILFKKTNIVLIGMPSSGKSTLGFFLAKELNRELIETDKLIEEEFKIKINNYLNPETEKLFREMEEKIINRESMKTGKIISTGGGVIKKWENIDHLRRNGLIIFIDRPLKNLTHAHTRPLTKTNKILVEIFNDRYEKYLEDSSIVVKNDNNLEEVKKNLLEAIYENFSN